jgi:tetratricopeptide (TPR) repeat protein
VAPTALTLLLLVGRDPTADRYRFRHALVQEAAYDQLLPSERRRLHQAYAVALEARPAASGAAEASRLVELAHHWRSAHEATRALHAAVQAGDASRAVYAYAEAGRQYERAIELWDSVPPADRPADRDLGDLYDDASATATLVGDGSRAVTLSQRAIELVDAAPGADLDRERRARARERLGFAAYLAGDTATSIQLLEEAVALLEGTPPSTAQSRVIAGLAANLMLMLLLKRSGAKLDRDVIFLATDGEEGHDETSIRNLIAKYWDKIAAKYAINEGGNVYVKNGKVQYVAVQASEKVSMNVMVTANGTGGHASIPLKDNAVTHLAAAVEKIGNYSAPVHFTTIVRRYFEGIAPLQDDEIGKWIRSLDTPDRGEHASRVISDANPMWNAMLRDTISPTMLTAGVRANVIPSEAKATLNVRLLPGAESFGNVILRRGMTSSFDLWDWWERVRRGQG